MHLFILALIIFVRSVFSALEVALLSLNYIKTKYYLDKNPKLENTLDIWEKHSEHILTTLFTINALTQIGIIAYVCILLENFFQRFSTSHIVLTLIVSIIIILICEIIPKLIAKRKPEIIPFILIKLLYYFSYLFIIPNRLFISLTNATGKLFGIQHTQTEQVITEEEIKTIIEMGEEEGTVEENERKMIHSIFEFADTIVREVMSPRVDMVCIEYTAKLIEAVKIVREHHHSRIPVYKENIDNIVGILYAKDILDYVASDQFDKIMLKDFMHTPMFVPETKLIHELLHEFRKTKTHLAIAVDEYGGTSGLVTIEDILEEIIGEIQDEYDTDEEELYRISPNGNYIIHAKMPITEFKELIGIEGDLEDESDYDTLGGYVFSQLGTIPKKGTVFVRHNIEFEVLEADRKRIKKLKVSLINTDTEDNKNGSTTRSEDS